MIDPIADPQIQELADSLADRVPTAQQIRDAMALAYQAGVFAGRLAVCNDMLTRINEAAR